MGICTPTPDSSAPDIPAMKNSDEQIILNISSREFPSWTLAVDNSSRQLPKCQLMGCLLLIIAIISESPLSGFWSVSELGVATGQQ